MSCNLLEQGRLRRPSTPRRLLEEGSQCRAIAEFGACRSTPGNAWGRCPDPGVSQASRICSVVTVAVVTKRMVTYPRRWSMAASDGSQAVKEVRSAQRRRTADRPLPRARIPTGSSDRRELAAIAAGRDEASSRGDSWMSTAWATLVERAGEPGDRAAQWRCRSMNSVASFPPSATTMPCAPAIAPVDPSCPACRGRTPTAAVRPFPGRSTSVRSGRCAGELRSRVAHLATVGSRALEQ